MLNIFANYGGQDDLTSTFLSVFNLLRYRRRESMLDNETMNLFWASNFEHVVDIVNVLDDNPYAFTFFDQFRYDQIVWLNDSFSEFHVEGLFHGKAFGPNLYRVEAVNVSIDQGWLPSAYSSTIPMLLLTPACLAKYQQDKETVLMREIINSYSIFHPDKSLTEISTKIMWATMSALLKRYCGQVIPVAGNRSIVATALKFEEALNDVLKCLVQNWRKLELNIIKIEVDPLPKCLADDITLFLNMFSQIVDINHPTVMIIGENYNQMVGMLKMPYYGSQREMHKLQDKIGSDYQGIYVPLTGKDQNGIDLQLKEVFKTFYKNGIAFPTVKP